MVISMLGLFGFPFLSFGPGFDLKLLPLMSSADHPQTKEVLFNSNVLSKVHSRISVMSQLFDNTSRSHGHSDKHYGSVSCGSLVNKILVSTLAGHVGHICNLQVQSQWRPKKIS